MRRILGAIPKTVFAGPTLFLAALPAAQAQQVYQTPTISIVGVTPTMGTGIDKDKLPANIQVVDPGQEKQMAPKSLADTLDDRLGAVSLSDYQGNPLQASLSFRGFTASPVLGEPQGLAVYQNGMRLNEAFGDLVNWDLMPSFAVRQVQVLPGSNPVFGLNALGGAIALRMKDGFSTQGSSVELAGGSFGRGRIVAETARQFDNRLAFYGGVSAQYDGGWRQDSPSRLAQSYTDLAWRKGDLDLGLGVTLAASDLSNLAASPIQLLSQSRDAVFTSPDTTRNAMAAFDLRANYDLTDLTSLQGTAYYRHLRSVTRNGNLSGFQTCATDPGLLCDNNGAPLTDRAGNPVSSTASGTGVNNNTATLSDGLGIAAQVSHGGRLLDHANSLVAGVSTDRGWTDYRTSAELGAISSERGTLTSGTILGGDAFNVSLGAQNIYYGIYATDTFSLLDTLHLTAAARYNSAALHLHDKLGSGLDGSHHYDRINPSVGLSWQALPALTLYASYSEANRVPTAAELGCADPQQPCRVPNAFTSDPGLKQVVSRTVEVGARGPLALAGQDHIDWTLSAFSTRSDDDIIFISSNAVTGSGTFANAGATLRQGIEAGAEASVDRWKLFANYALVRATFDSAFAIQSPLNSAADANGNIQVRRGDRLPGLPLHSLKLGADYRVSDSWTVGSDLRWTSDRVLRGDESNSMPKIPGFAVVNLSTSYRVAAGAELFARVQNLFDRRYATAGALGDATPLFASFTDHRFLVPGEPRSFWVGTRLNL